MSRTKSWRGAGHLYELSDPAEPERVRYVGITSQRDPYVYNLRRFRQWSSPTKPAKTHLARWLRSLNAKGAEPHITVQTFADVSWNELCALEKDAIKTRRAEGHDLCNLTDGGDGVCGLSVPRTPEWNKKVGEGVKRSRLDDSSIQQRINENRIQTLLERYGTTDIQRFRKNFVSPQKGKPWTEEQKEKARASHRARWERYRAEGRNDDVRRSISEGTRRAMADPEVRAKISVGLMGREPWNKNQGKKPYDLPTVTPEEKAARRQRGRDKNSEHSAAVWANYTEEQRAIRGQSISEAKKATADGKLHRTPRRIHVGEAKGLGISIGKSKGKAARNGWILPIVPSDNVRVIEPAYRMDSSP